MNRDISLLIKECIAAHVTIQTENGNPIGYFLDEAAINKIVSDINLRLSENK